MTKKDNKNSNITDNNMLVELSCNEIWFDTQFIEEKNTLMCLSNEGSIVQI